MELIKAKLRGYAVKFNNIFLSSRYDPVKDGENVFLKYRNILDEKEYIFFISVFPVYHVDCFLKKLQPHSKLFFIDILNDSGALNLLKIYNDKNEISSETYGIIKKNYYKADEFIKYFSEMLFLNINPEKILFVEYDRFNNIFKSEYFLFKEKIQQILDSRLKETATVNYFEKTWSINSIKNSVFSKNFNF